MTSATSALAPAAPPASPAPRLRLPREARMEQTLAAAHALFAERGYATVTMDEVAAAVGVTKPLLYNYFGNKERLYLACMEPAGEALLATVLGAVERSSSPADALRLGIHAFFEFVDRDRGAWRVLFDETLPVESGIAQRVGEYRARLADLVAERLIEQLSPSCRAEVDALSAALLGGVEALARWWLRSEALSAREAAELLILTVEPGLRVLVEIQRAREARADTVGASVRGADATGASVGRAEAAAGDGVVTGSAA